MLDQIKGFFGIDEQDEAKTSRTLDKNLAAATLMVHVIAADGKITPDEEERLLEVLAAHYTVSREDAAKLAEQAKTVQAEAIDLYAFTSILKSDMTDEERRALVEDLWEMTYADGKVHEFEDNVVWRTAELLGILQHERMALKQRVLARRQAGGE